MGLKKFEFVVKVQDEILAIIKHQEGILRHFSYIELNISKTKLFLGIVRLSPVRQTFPFRLDFFFWTRFM